MMNQRDMPHISSQNWDIAYRSSPYRVVRMPKEATMMPEGGIMFPMVLDAIQILEAR